MRRPGGYAVLTTPDGGKKEADTFTCKHCNRLTHVKPFQDPADLGGLCKCCMGLICSNCVGKPCDVIEKKLERAEASYHARRSYGLG
jgi:hypothetical protein